MYSVFLVSIILGVSTCSGSLVVLLGKPRKYASSKVLDHLGSPWITSDPPQDHLCLIGENAEKTQTLGYLWIPSGSAPGDPGKSKLLSHLSAMESILAPFWPSLNFPAWPSFPAGSKIRPLEGWMVGLVSNMLHDRRGSEEAAWAWTYIYIYIYTYVYMYIYI